MTETLLVLNAGSSSLKFQVFRLADLIRLAGGQVSRIDARPMFEASLETGESETEMLAGGADHQAALQKVLAFVGRHRDWHMEAVVHRVVHGGTHYVEPVLVTAKVVAALTTLSALAPLHQPHNLAAIAASARLMPEVPDIACFDTAFHAGRDELFQTFAINRALRDKGIRRYGFHGISYQWIARVLAAEHPDRAAGRVVAAHLGNGASLCAMRGGRSIDTTMSMTALDGLPMGTRSGAIDPGAVIYMARELAMPIEEVEVELYDRAGLLGLSGVSNDVRTLLESSEPRASFALDYYALKVAQYAAMMAASLGGMDTLVFTAGIGEHATSVRRAILDRLAFLGKFETLVIPTNEEKMMAIEAKRLLQINEKLRHSPTREIG